MAKKLTAIIFQPLPFIYSSIISIYSKESRSQESMPSFNINQRKMDYSSLKNSQNPD